MLQIYIATPRLTGSKAYSKASQVRQEVNSSLEDLPDSFAKMDMYLQSYPKDANIVKASTNLVLAIFKAIENSIKFYTSVQGEIAAEPSTFSANGMPQPREPASQSSQARSTKQSSSRA
jgi:hypothetical protein